eukprot:1338904-Amorphochlora_amoeboformis.AAC.1
MEGQLVVQPHRWRRGGREALIFWPIGTVILVGGSVRVGHVGWGGYERWGVLIGGQRRGRWLFRPECGWRG